jgi:uncharacterized protein GlcG (DUF336 family)
LPLHRTPVVSGKVIGGIGYGGGIGAQDQEHADARAAAIG